MASRSSDPQNAPGRHATGFIKDLLQLRQEFNALNKMWVEVIFEIA
jgi:hypothetical protein